RNVRDEVPTIGHDPHQVFLLKTYCRLPHRRPAAVISLGQSLFTQRFPRLVLARDDALLERLVDSLTERPVPLVSQSGPHSQASYAGPAPSYLTDEKPTSYYGETVWHGYVAQPANQVIRTTSTQSTFHVTGSGVTDAVIDTGVDPTNPVLQNLLVSGYDFTRNVNGGSEKSDVSTSPDLSQAQTAQVNQRTVAVLDQRTVAVLDGSQYSA